MFLNLVLIVFVGSSTVCCVDYSKDPFVQDKLNDFDTAAFDGQSVKSYYTDVVNFFESNADTVINIVQDFKKVKGYLNSDRIVLSDAIETMKGFQEKAINLERIRSIIYYWIDKRTWSFSKNSHEHSVMDNMMATLRGLKTDLESYKQYMESFNKFILKKMQYELLYVVSGDSVDQNIKDNIMKIDHKAFKKGFLSVYETMETLSK